MGKNPSTHWTEGGVKAWWAVDPAEVIWRKEKFCTPARIHTPVHPSCSIVTVVDLFCLFFYAIVIWDYVVSNGRMGMNKEQGRHGRCQSWPNVWYCPSICLRNWGGSWYSSGWLVSLLGFKLSTCQIQVRNVTACFPCFQNPTQSLTATCKDLYQWQWPPQPSQCRQILHLLLQFHLLVSVNCVRPQQITFIKLRSQ